MSKLSFLEHIFSITNLVQHKQICFLGIKIKFPREIKYNDTYDNLPIVNNRIVVRNHIGSYGCEPKYIVEELLKQNLPYEIIWVVNRQILKFINDYPKQLKLVMKGSPEELKAYKTAKIWVDNERRSYYVKKGLCKRPEQVYIQTFHGSLGIKKTGIDRNDVTKSALKVAKKDASNVDYLISNGTYTTDFFKRIFQGYGTILETGHPRNDVFFKKDSDLKKKVYESFNIPEDKHIVLYAPTLREDRDMTCYTLDFDRLTESLSKKFGGEWVVMSRLHPLMIDYKDKLNMNFSNVIDATDYSDIQELLVSADAIVTDYSSCIYDFMLSRKPGFIYATDVEKYNNGRGLYYPLTSTPFPVASNNDEMVKNIEQFDYDTYKVGVEEFLKGKGCIDDGHASERVVELIKNIINNAQEKEPTDKQEACV